MADGSERAAPISLFATLQFKRVMRFVVTVAIANVGQGGSLPIEKLVLLGFTSQARFLMNAGITDALSDLDPSDVRRFLPAANAVQKLLSEAEMGELFKVIAFSRGIDDTLAAFSSGDRSHTL